MLGITLKIRVSAQQCVPASLMDCYKKPKVFDKPSSGLWWQCVDASSSVWHVLVLLGGHKCYPAGCLILKCVSCCKVVRISCLLKLNLVVSFKKSLLSFAGIAEPVASGNEPVPASTTEQQVRLDCFFLCLYTEIDCGNSVGSASKCWFVNVPQYKWLIFYRHSKAAF